MNPAEKPALILVDIQKGLDEYEYYGGQRNNPGAEENARKILDTWRTIGLPIFHIKHNSVQPDSPLFKGKPGNDIKDIVKPKEGEPLFEKNVNSAFIGTGLKDELERQNIRTVVIVGLTTDQCVSTTTRMAGNLGYDTWLISDATATFDRTGPDGMHFTAEQMHGMELASLNEEFATVVSTNAILKMLETK